MELHREVRELSREKQLEKTAGLSPKSREAERAGEAGGGVCILPCRVRPHRVSYREAEVGLFLYPTSIYRIPAPVSLHSRCFPLIF